MSDEQPVGTASVKTEKAVKPGKTAKPVKAKKEKKPVFGLVDSADEGVYPFSSPIPEGYEFGKTQGLKKRDFAEEYIYLEHRALEAEAKAVALRAKAEESKKLGSSKQRGKAKRLLKLQEQFAALRESLEGQGIDVDALLDGKD